MHYRRRLQPAWRGRRGFDLFRRKKTQDMLSCRPKSHSLPRFLTQRWEFAGMALFLTSLQTPGRPFKKNKRLK